MLISFKVAENEKYSTRSEPDLVTSIENALTQMLQERRGHLSINDSDDDDDDDFS